MKATTDQMARINGLQDLPSPPTVRHPLIRPHHHQRPQRDEHRREICRHFANREWVRIEQRRSSFSEDARAATTPFHRAINPSMSSLMSSCCPRNGAGSPSSEF